MDHATNNADAKIGIDALLKLTGTDRAKLKPMLFYTPRFAARK